MVASKDLLSDNPNQIKQYPHYFSGSTDSFPNILYQLHSEFRNVLGINWDKQWSSNGSCNKVLNFDILYYSFARNYILDYKTNLAWIIQGIIIETCNELKIMALTHD